MTKKIVISSFVFTVCSLLHTNLDQEEIQRPTLIQQLAAHARDQLINDVENAFHAIQRIRHMITTAPFFIEYITQAAECVKNLSEEIVNQPITQENLMGILLSHDLVGKYNHYFSDASFALQGVEDRYEAALARLKKHFPILTSQLREKHASEPDAIVESQKNMSAKYEFEADSRRVKIYRALVYL